jgi:nitroimidazol reductase NimA-like FMN-containing flavoprotein (pyridoxamine 5'-phosphate oxidase superfamily)
MDDITRVQSILQANAHMVLSTANKNGNPWITPVAYTFDKNNSLYWVSSKDARHSSNIRARKEVAIVIYMTEPIRDAVYIEAEAQELVNDTEITSAIAAINTRTQPDKYRVKSLSDVSGQASWRIYKAAPKTMYVREQSMVGNQAVTVRRKIA